MADCKYVIFGQKAMVDHDPPTPEEKAGDEDRVLIFGANEYHAEIALLYTRQFPGLQPVGAGFIGFSVDSDGCPKAACYGYSSSLKLTARECDDKIVNRALGMNRRD